MTKHLLSKSTYIRGYQCVKSLYLNKKRPFLRDKISPLQLAKFKRGTNVGLLAQGLFPDGVDCQPKSPSQFTKKLQETSEALSNPNVHTIYEGVFQHDEVLIIIDMMVRDGEGWKAYEVKSSRSISDTYMQDAALQYYVISGSGVHLTDFSIIYMNQEYLKGEDLDLHQLFTMQSVLEEAKKSEADIAFNIHEFKKILQLESSPPIDIGLQCHSPYPCDFIGHCWKKIPESSFLYMDSLDEKLRFDFHYNGAVMPQDLPGSVFETEAQRIQFESFTTNSIGLNPTLAKAQVPTLKQLSEAAVFKLLAHQPAVPLLVRSKPYDSLPLALFVKTSQGEETVFFEQSKAGLFQFQEKVNNLLSTHSLVITDDDSALLLSWQTAARVVHSEAKNMFPTEMEKLIGLKQLKERIECFLPEKNSEFFLLQMLKAVGHPSPKLKEEVYLVNDFLAGESESESLRVANELVHYGKAITFCFEKLSEMTHQ